MKILVISIRSFGDCIVTLELVKYLALDKNIQIDIFTKNEFKQFFTNDKNINEIYTSIFPVGVNGKFSPISLFALFKKSLKLKKQNYDIVLNNIGDFREQAIGFLIAKNANISIKLPKNHPFNNLIRRGLNFLVDRLINIPEKMINIYDMQKYIAENILDKKIALNVDGHIDNKRTKFAIHPTASQECRRWDFDKWIKLIDTLSAKDKVLVFCAPNEKKYIEDAFVKIKDKIEIVASNLELFFKNLENVHTLICLDSFALHAAYYKNVENIIMLNGANNFEIWLPPNAKVVQGDFTCDHFPCYNKPKCLNQDKKFICIKSIKVDDILCKIEKNG
ncbi:MAG: hypothetical protein LBG67_02420 [Campylobacteraceae bacterium]|nr:hypothetical protein [Campylobacteraceae bacterium]